MSQQELTAGHSLRATHEVLSTLSGSKRALETILENQTDIFCIINDNVQVIKGNRSLARFMKHPVDLLFNMSLRSIFSSESWLMFNNRVEILKKQKDRRHISFELPIDAEQGAGEPQDFLWTVSRFDAISKRRGEVFTVVGRDMTEIKHFQKRVGSIFNSVPLGIFQINKQKKLSAPYSAHTEVIFGRDNLDAVPVNEVLVDAYPKMSTNQKFGIDQLLESIGGEEFWFDIYKSHFPKELNVGKERDVWIGLSYSPVVRDGQVEEILVVAEDISERVAARRVKDSRDNQEGAYATIFADAREADLASLEFTVFDIELQISHMHKLSKDGFNNPAQFLNPLHAIKGTARSSGLAYFSSVIHEIEDETLALFKDGSSLQTQFSSVEKQRRDVIDSWTTVKNILQIVHPELLNDGSMSMDQVLDHMNQLQAVLAGGDVTGGKDILAKILGKSSGRHMPKSTRELANKMAALVSKTAASLNKDVTLELDLDELAMPAHLLAKLGEVLTYLVSNAIDHGVEEGEERAKAGKPAQATLKIAVKRAKIGGSDGLQISVEDDGRGIDPDHLLKSALEKGLVTAEKAAAMSKEEKLRLIFAPGFTTKGSASLISGRGVGMDAADRGTAAISLDGQGLKMHSIVGRGTNFQFSCKLS